MAMCLFNFLCLFFMIIFHFSLCRNPERRCLCWPEQVPVPCRHHPLAGYYQESPGWAAGGTVQQQQQRMWVKPDTFVFMWIFSCVFQIVTLYLLQKHIQWWLWLHFRHFDRSPRGPHKHQQRHEWWPIPRFYSLCLPGGDLEAKSQSVRSTCEPFYCGGVIAAPKQAPWSCCPLCSL